MPPPARLGHLQVDAHLDGRRDAVLAEVAGLIDNWEEAVGGEGPGVSPTATGSGLVGEGPDAEADAAGYGGAVEERPISKAKVKENARVVAATATSKAPPPGQGPGPAKGLVEDDKEAKRHAIEAGRALNKRSPELLERGSGLDLKPAKKARTTLGEGGRPKLELKERKVNPDWRDDISSYKDESEPGGRHPRKIGGGGDPPPGGGGGDPSDDDKGDRDKKDKKKVGKKKDKGRSSSSSSRRGKLRATHLVPAQKRKKKKPSDDGDGDSSSSQGGKKKRPSKKKEKKEKDEEKKKKKKKKKAGSSSGGTSGSSSLDSDEDLYGKDAQKYQSLLQKAKRRPGKLLRKGLEQMSQYLAARVGESDDVGETWRDQRVGAYLNQVLFTQHPPKEIGVRNVRELITLGECIDLLMSNELPRLGDVLMQRLKAVEASLSEGWAVASQQELIPGPRATLTAPAEKSFAAKQALQHQKLEELLRKRKAG